LHSDFALFLDGELNNHVICWNLIIWFGNLNAKWIGIWFVQKILVVHYIHCWDGVFDNMWFNCEPYIVVLSWNSSFILFIIINSNNWIVCWLWVFEASTLKSPNIIMGHKVENFDIRCWSVNKKVVKNKCGGLYVVIIWITRQMLML